MSAAGTEMMSSPSISFSATLASEKNIPHVVIASPAIPTNTTTIPAMSLTWLPLFP